MENTDFPLNFKLYLYFKTQVSINGKLDTLVFEVEKKTETNVFELPRYCGEWIPYYFCLKNKASQ